MFLCSARYSQATSKPEQESERFFHSARSRSESAAALQPVESDAAMWKKIRFCVSILGWFDYREGNPRNGFLPHRLSLSHDRLRTERAIPKSKAVILQKQRNHPLMFCWGHYTTFDCPGQSRNFC